jgi:hypothetical protein
VHLKARAGVRFEAKTEIREVRAEVSTEGKAEMREKVRGMVSTEVGVEVSGGEQRRERTCCDILIL